MKKMNQQAMFSRWLKTSVAVLAIMLMTGFALAAGFTATVNVDKMPVYSEKKVKIGTLPAGTQVKVTEYSSTWAKIDHKSLTLYVPLKYLHLNDRIVGYTTKAIPMYKTASTKQKLGTIPYATKLYVAGRDGKFFLVEDETGSISGYVNGNKYLSRKNPAESDGFNNTYASDVTKLVNAVRGYYGLNILKSDADLVSASQIRAKEIVTKFSHTRPNGTTWRTVSGKAAGENIDKSEAVSEQEDAPKQIVLSWLAGSAQRSNMLNANFASTGVAVYEYQNTIYWVQLFGLQ